MPLATETSAVETKAAETETKPETTAAAETKTETTDTTKAESGASPAAKAESDASVTKPAASEESPAAPKPYTFEVTAEDPYTEADAALLAAEALELGLDETEGKAWFAQKKTQAAAQSKAYEAELRADPALGGANFDATVALADKGIGAVWPKGTPAHEEITSWLKRTGLSRSKIIVEGFARLGKMIGEDGPVGGLRDAPPAPVEMHERLYGEDGFGPKRQS